jgi:hypothetical protein
MTIIRSMTSHNFPAGYKLGDGEKARANGTDLLGLAIDKLTKEGAKSPIERARDEIFEKHGIDEQRYAILSDTDRQTLDLEISAAIEKAVKRVLANGDTTIDRTRYG